MHTCFSFVRPRLLLGLIGALLFGGVGPGMPTPVAAQEAFPGAPEEPGINVRVYPLDAWSPRVGVGVGAGLVVHHLGRRHAQGLFTVGPARHEQVVTAAWASANPDGARQYVLLRAQGLHTNRDWFYGLGPASSEEARQSIERSAGLIRVQGGQRFLDRRLVVQPHVGLSLHRIDRVPRPSAPTLSVASRTHLLQLANEDIGPLEPQHTGFQAGLTVQYDSRLPDSHTSSGFLLEGGWLRYVGVTSSFVQYDQLDLGAFGYLSLREAHRLIGRLWLTRTVARGRAAVPYFLRPTLGRGLVPGWARHRFVASDRLIGSVLYRFPLADPFRIFHLEGHLGIHAASVYDDVFSQAAFNLTFEETLDADRSSVPLRPAASVGLHFRVLSRKTPSLDLALGLSPEGVNAVRFTLKQDLGTLRRPHHRIRR